MVFNGADKTGGLSVCLGRGTTGAQVAAWSLRGSYLGGTKWIYLSQTIPLQYAHLDCYKYKYTYKYKYR